MKTTARLLFPNLTDAAGYQRVLLTMWNTIAREPVRSRRRADLEAKSDATLAEGVERFGRLAFLSKTAFCPKCGKELRNKTTADPSGILYRGCERYDPEAHCDRRRCDHKREG